MKLLYLCHRIPYPPNKGDKIRSFNEIKHLAQSHEIHLACLADEAQDRQYVAALEKYCTKVECVAIGKTLGKLKGLCGAAIGRPITVGYFYSSVLQQQIDVWLADNRYDAIICFSSPMAEYVFKSRLWPDIQARLIMDYCDLDSDKWRQYSTETKPPYRWVYYLEHRLLFEYEKKINRLFDLSVFVSPLEGRLFIQLYPQARKVKVIPNGVDYHYFSPAAIEAQPEVIRDAAQKYPILLFVGAMDYYANVDGVVWFSDKVFPAIRAQYPNAHFYIVGSNPDEKVLRLKEKEHIVVTGFVDDVRPYYRQADICVVPLRLARGVQNKVLEAMSMGKAIVASPSATQGIEGIGDEQARIAIEANDFINDLLNLCANEKVRGELGANARNFVMHRYDWRNNMQLFELSI